MLHKNIISRPLAFFCLGCILAGCTNAQKTDLSTDEAVLAVLQRRADAKRTDLGRKVGDKLEAGSVCIERLKESAKVIVVGYFAYDRGCRMDGAFVDSIYVEGSDPVLSKNALSAFGWEKAVKKERERLAEYWVEKGLLAFLTVLQTQDKDLNDNEFHQARSVTDENHEIIVTLWIQLPSRMRAGKEFRRLEYKFAKDGNLILDSALKN